MKERSWIIDVWKQPHDDKEYFIGGDPAGGMASSTYSVAHVLSEDLEVVAVLMGKIDPDEYEKAVEALGYCYNRAKICIERNRDGQGINTHLMNRNYPNLYFGREYKVRGQMTDPRPGIYLGRTNRRKVINTLVDAVRNDVVTIHHEDTLDQMSTFVRDDDGEAGAMQGFYDDCVLSLSYAVIAYEESGMTDTDLTNRTKKDKTEVEEKKLDKSPHYRAVGEDGNELMWPE